MKALDKAVSIAFGLLGVKPSPIARKRVQGQRRPLVATDYYSPAFIASKSFLLTDDWKRCRYDILRRHGGGCQACGRTAKDGIVINVDHIISRRDRPDLALNPENGQCLCGPCNAGKGNRYADDWR